MAKKRISKADQFALARHVYDSASKSGAVEKAIQQLSRTVKTKDELATKLLRHEGIKLTRKQVEAHFKRENEKLVQDANRKEWARQDVGEAADLLASARNACEGIENGDEVNRYDHVESARFARLAIEETGRRLKEQLGILGVEFKPSFLE